MRNLQFPAKNFWGEDATPSRSSTSESSIPVPPDVPPSAGWEVPGGAMTGRETRSTRGVGCFRGRSKTWQRWFCQLPSMFLGISMFLQVKLGGRISRPTVVNDDFQVVSGIHKLEPVVVRPVRGCMFMPISRCFTTNTHTNHLHTRMTPTNLGEVSLRVANINTWNPKQPFRNGCFNWMIPNLYIENGWKSPNIHF